MPCGKCNYCLDRRRKDWAFRLRVEDRVSLSSYFLTLTYSPENLPMTENGVATLCKRHVQLWMKRVRKRQARYVRLFRLREEKPIRFYLVGEYGTMSNRPHYHVIMFNVLPHVIAEAGRIWSKGFVDVGTVTPASINYVSGYVMCKPVDLADRARPFASMSNRPGIGSSYIKTHKNWHLDERRFYVQDGAFRGAIPRYYKERIFTPAMRLMGAANLLRERAEKEVDELLELCEFHPDPWQYRNERLVHGHELIGSRLLKHNELKTI